MADHSPIIWRKSRYSDQSQCVEVAAWAGRLLVRDSKDPDGPRLVLSSATWRRFTDRVRAGHFDH